MRPAATPMGLRSSLDRQPERTSVAGSPSVTSANVPSTTRSGTIKWASGPTSNVCQNGFDSSAGGGANRREFGLFRLRRGRFRRSSSLLSFWSSLRRAAVTGSAGSTACETSMGTAAPGGKK